MGILRCPVCRGRLELEDGSYRCGRGHSFDRSAAGYVHLLPVNQMRSREPGDNKQMVAARRSFLSKGYYQPVSDRLNEVVAEHCRTRGGRELHLADVGCGEGYYTNRLAQALAQAGVEAHLYGLDISKWAVQSAAKAGRGLGIQYGVASLFDLPLRDHSCQVLVNVFAPVCIPEFHRVLKRGGLLVFAIGGPRHLWGLKERIYDQPYENPIGGQEYQGFTLLQRCRVERMLHLPCQEDIDSLFTMTPYYYKSSVETARRVHQLGELDTQLEVELLIYRAV